MLKYSLQAVIKMCSDNGGSFYHSSQSHSWFVDKRGKIKNVQKPETEFTLNENHFLINWIYEPPKQSAFKEWNITQPAYYHPNRVEYNARKEGWNGAIDAVLESEDGFVMGIDFSDETPSTTKIFITKENIKALKEP